MNIVFLKLAISYLLTMILTACSGGEKDDKAREYVNASVESDFLWQDCAWLTREEFAELDRLRKNIEDSPSTTKDDFDRYVKILNLNKKTDAELMKCTKASAGDRQRLMEHFVFLGLSYGQGQFSFIDKPRMASIFEMDYFYFYGKRKLLLLGLLNRVSIESENANERLVKYLLGGIIAMQAALRSKNGDANLDPIAQKIANELSIIKYGRTQLFNMVLYNIRDKLLATVAQFLFADQAFSKAYNAMNIGTKTKTYPMHLKEEFPGWPEDYSEVFAENHNHLSKLSATVFGISTSPGGTALGTGFFAKRNNGVLFLTSGHWAWNGRLYIMQQKNSKPFGKEASKLVWFDDELKVFNFSEQLLSPTLEALGFSGLQLQALLNKLGTNPYGGSYGGLTALLPWIDIAFSLPSDTLIAKAGLVKSSLPELYELPESVSTTAIALGFGITEDLLKGDLTTNKSPGLRRLTHGMLWSLSFEDKKTQIKTVRQVMGTPRTLKEIELASFVPTFSMLMYQRCSGAPFIIDYETDSPRVTGVLQGPWSYGKEQIGLRAAHFTKNLLKLIDALIAGPQKPSDIQKSELTNLVRTHMFHDAQYRDTIKMALVTAYDI